MVNRLEKVVAATGSPGAAPADLKAALKAATEIESFVAARRAELIRSLGEHPTAFAEAAIAETSGCSLGAASKEKERADTLGHAGAMCDALSDGAITSGHVDALTRAARGLDAAATSLLFGDDGELAQAASTRSIAEFDAWVKRRAKQLDTSDGEERLEQQRRAVRLRTWTDDDGMWNLSGRFDPATGKDIARELAARTKTIAAGELVSTAPSDPIERMQHIEALALADLIVGDAPAGASAGPPLVVIDASQSDGAGGPVVDWGIPVELPPSVLVEVFEVNDPEVVIVANGVVLHASGRTDLGRSTRLANRAQRRALNGLYATCAVPGCAVHYNRCKLHHIVWWRNGGRTDLENLLPVCQHHHTLIHNDHWEITLGANRELTIGLSTGRHFERVRPDAAPRSAGERRASTRRSDTYWRPPSIAGSRLQHGRLQRGRL